MSSLDALKVAASEVRRSVGVRFQPDRLHENLLAGKTKIGAIGMRGRWCGLSMRFGVDIRCHSFERLDMKSLHFR